MRRAETFPRDLDGILARVLIPALVMLLAGVTFLSLAERPRTAGLADARSAAPRQQASTPSPYFRRCQNTNHAPCR